MVKGHDRISFEKDMCKNNQTHCDKGNEGRSTDPEPRRDSGAQFTRDRDVRRL